MHGRAIDVVRARVASRATAAAPGLEDEVFAHQGRAGAVLAKHTGAPADDTSRCRRARVESRTNSCVVCEVESERSSRQRLEGDTRRAGERGRRLASLPAAFEPRPRARDEAVAMSSRRPATCRCSTPGPFRPLDANATYAFVESHACRRRCTAHRDRPQRRLEALTIAVVPLSVTKTIRRSIRVPIDESLAAAQGDGSRRHPRPSATPPPLPEAASRRDERVGAGHASGCTAADRP